MPQKKSIRKEQQALLHPEMGLNRFFFARILNLARTHGPVRRSEPKRELSPHQKTPYQFPHSFPHFAASMGHFPGHPQQSSPAKDAIYLHPGEVHQHISHHFAKKGPHILFYGETNTTDFVQIEILYLHFFAQYPQCSTNCQHATVTISHTIRAFSPQSTRIFVHKAPRKIFIYPPKNSKNVRKATILAPNIATSGQLKKHLKSALVI